VATTMTATAANPLHAHPHGTERVATSLQRVPTPSAPAAALSHHCLLCASPSTCAAAASMPAVLICGGQVAHVERPHLTATDAMSAAGLRSMMMASDYASAPSDTVPGRDTTSNASSSFFNGCLEGRRFTVQEVIGKGSYGTVCAAVDNLTGEKVAIKRIQNVFDNVADATRILRETLLLRHLKHPDIVEIKHIMLPPNPRTFKDLYIVFELMESDLHTVIGANDDLTPNHHKVFLYQLLRGLAFVHETGVLHRDLKPKNILANSNCKLKICDFGLARPFFGDETPTMWTDYVATRWYRAPELCGCFYGCYSPAVDIWSIGCMFAETLLGTPLFPGRDAVSQLHLVTDLLGKPPAEVIDRISNPKARVFLHALPDKAPKSFAQKFRNLDPEGLDLLQRLLSFDPMDRPSAVEALEHSYFNGLPRATPVDIRQIPDEEFAFEQLRLSEAEVRELIYLEALQYHPNVLAQYTIGSCRMPVQMTHLEMDNDDVKRQFMFAEQFGRMSQHSAQPASAAWLQPAYQPTMSGGIASVGSWPMHPHVGAYRAQPMDATSIAAAAAVAMAQHVGPPSSMGALQYTSDFLCGHKGGSAATPGSIHRAAMAAAQHAAAMLPAESNVSYGSQALASEC